MLAPSMVLEIRRLLAEGIFSQRKIARLTGVSRGSVGAIASGKRPDYELRSRVEDKFERPAGPPRRCPTCGGMVYMPCRLCALRRRLAAKGRSRRPQPWPQGLLGLELRDEHRRRYERVRAWRIQAERLGGDLGSDFGGDLGGELGSDLDVEMVVADEMR